MPPVPRRGRDSERCSPCDTAGGWPITPSSRGAQRPKLFGTSCPASALAHPARRRGDLSGKSNNLPPESPRLRGESVGRSPSDGVAAIRPGIARISGRKFLVSCPHRGTGGREERLNAHPFYRSAHCPPSPGGGAIQRGAVRATVRDDPGHHNSCHASWYRGEVSACLHDDGVAAIRPGIARISGRMFRAELALYRTFFSAAKRKYQRKAATAWCLRRCHHEGIARGLRSVILTVLGRIPVRSTSCLAHLCSVAEISCLEDHTPVVSAQAGDQ